MNFANYAEQNAAPVQVRAASLSFALHLVGDVERDAPVSLENSELPQAHHLRDDLWRGIAAVKRDGRMCSAPKLAAYCEVQLAWAGYEAAEGGWRHVAPYVRIAEDYCLTAMNTAPAPYGVRVARTVPRIAEARPSVDPPTMLPIDVATAPLGLAAGAPDLATASIDIPSMVDHGTPSIVVLFPHDRDRLHDILAPGRQQLLEFAQQLRALPNDMVVTVVGHTDITGTFAHNRALAARRAGAVAEALAAEGVDRHRIHASALGSSDPWVTCRPVRAHQRDANYLACLKPNRRVVVRVSSDLAGMAPKRGGH